MAVTRPFFKKTSFTVLLVGVILAVLGLSLSAQAILTMSTNVATSVMWGVFFGMGDAFIIMASALRQQEKKLNAKNF
jgi:hypothetical protein